MYYGFRSRKHYVENLRKSPKKDWIFQESGGNMIHLPKLTDKHLVFIIRCWAEDLRLDYKILQHDPVPIYFWDLFARETECNLALILESSIRGVNHLSGELAGLDEWYIARINWEFFREFDRVIRRQKQSWLRRLFGG